MKSKFTTSCWHNIMPRENEKHVDTIQWLPDKENCRYKILFWWYQRIRWNMQHKFTYKFCSFCFVKWNKFIKKLSRVRFVILSLLFNLFPNNKYRHYGCLSVCHLLLRTVGDLMKKVYYWNCLYENDLNWKLQVVIN